MPEPEQLGLIETYHGVAYSDFWDFQDEAGTPLVLTGKAFTCHVRAGSPDQPGAVVLAVSTANDKLTLPGSPAGRIALALTAADLGGTSLPAGDYYYELVDVTGGSPADVIDRGWWCHRPSGAGRD